MKGKEFSELYFDYLSERLSQKGFTRLNNLFVYEKGTELLILSKVNFRGQFRGFAFIITHTFSRDIDGNLVEKLSSYLEKYIFALRPEQIRMLNKNLDAYQYDRNHLESIMGFSKFEIRGLSNGQTMDNIEDLSETQAKQYFDYIFQVAVEYGIPIIKQWTPRFSLDQLEKNGLSGKADYFERIYIEDCKKVIGLI